MTRRILLGAIAVGAALPSVICEGVPNGYTKYWDTSCFSDRGAVELPVANVSVWPSSVDQCAVACDEDPACSCFTFESHAGGVCIVHGTCTIAECVRGAGGILSTYVKNKTTTLQLKLDAALASIGGSVGSQLYSRSASGMGEACKPIVSPEYQIHCGEGLRCITTMHRRGASGICMQLDAGDGEMCRPTVSPEYQIHCMEGLRCFTRDRSGASGICKNMSIAEQPRQYASVGEMCRTPEHQIHCEEGLRCVTPDLPGSLGGSPGLCKKMGAAEQPRQTAGEGEMCRPTVSPEYQIHCEEGLRCVTPALYGASGICQNQIAAEEQQELAGEGEMCMPSVSPEYQIHCKEGLLCVTPDLRGASGICKDMNAAERQREYAGEDEMCRPTVSPEYQIHCMEGLQCVRPDLPGASGICQSRTASIQQNSTLSRPSFRGSKVTNQTIR